MNRLVVHDSLHRLEEMTKQYKEIVTAGRSTPGPTQPNNVVVTATQRSYVVCVVGGAGIG